MAKAQNVARELLEGPLIDADCGPKVVVLLGLKVAQAFRRALSPTHKNICCSKMYSEALIGKKSLLLTVMPHPSGVSHHWNSQEKTKEAAEHLKKVCRLAGVSFT